MSAAIGISLGSESATLAVAPASVRDHNGTMTTDILQLRPVVIAAEDGERSTPAYTAYVNGEMLVGAPAKNAAIRHPQRSVSCLLPLLSKVKGFDSIVKADVDYEDASGTAFPTLEEGEEGPVAHTALEMTNALVALVKSLTVDAAGGRPVSSFVVSVPRYVDGDAVLKILKEASFPEAATVQVQYDDVSAALANGISGLTWTPKVNHQGVLVIDCGANVTSVSVLTCEGGSMVHKATEFSTKLNGRLVDKAIAKQLIEGFKRKTRMDPGEEGRPYRKLLVAAERVKKTLSSSPVASCEVEAYFEGMDLRDSVTRGKVDTCLSTDLFFFPQLEGLITRAIELATGKATKEGAEKVEKNEHFAISHVVLHGGTMRMPGVLNGVKSRVIDTIKEANPSAEQINLVEKNLVEILDEAPGDEAAGLGAALQASIVASTPEVEELDNGQLKRDATTFDLGLWASESAPTVGADGKITAAENAPEFQLVLQRGAPLPTELNIEIPAEGEFTLLFVARSSATTYTPVAESVTAKCAKTLTVLLKPCGEITVTPLVAFGVAEPLLKAKLF